MSLIQIMFGLKVFIEQGCQPSAMVSYVLKPSRVRTKLTMRVRPLEISRIVADSKPSPPYEVVLKKAIEEPNAGHSSRDNRHSLSSEHNERQNIISCFVTLMTFLVLSYTRCKKMTVNIR